MTIGINVWFPSAQKVTRSMYASSFIKDLFCVFIKYLKNEIIRERETLQSNDSTWISLEPETTGEF